MGLIESFFESTLLLKFSIAFISVLVIPYVLSKIISPWIRSSKNFESQSLSTLVRREMARLGKRSSPSRSYSNPNKKIGKGNLRDEVIELYRKKHQALEKSGGNEGEVSDLKKSLNLFEGAMRKHPQSFKSLCVTLDEITKCSIPPRQLMDHLLFFLSEKTFIISKEEGILLNYSSIKNLLFSKTILSGLTQDALLESSTLCQIIEQRKNKPGEKIYMAIRLMILLKLGGSQKALYQMAASQPKAIKQKFKQLKSYQLNNAIFSLLRQGRGQYLHPNKIYPLLYKHIDEFEHFEREYISEQSRKQERKRRKGKKHFHSESPTSHPTEKFYDILECRETDSTAVIKKSYRRLALKSHPDRVEGVHDEFLKIREAYDEILMARGEKQKKAA